MESMPENGVEDGDFVRIGQSYTAVWVKIVSGWLCHIFYGWSLIAPIIMPDRFGVSYWQRQQQQQQQTLYRTDFSKQYQNE